MSVRVMVGHPLGSMVLNRKLLGWVGGVIIGGLVGITALGGFHGDLPKRCEPASICAFDQAPGQPWLPDSSERGEKAGPSTDAQTATVSPSSGVLLVGRPGEVGKDR